MKKWILIFCLVLLMILLGGCSKSNNTVEKTKTEVCIYYVDSKTSALVSEIYQLISTKQEEQIEELLYMLKLNPENLLFTSALPDTLEVKDFYFNEDSSLTVDFDSSYSELTGIQEVLCRAAIVKTLSQIIGVEYIQFNVNEQPLMDSGGNLVGIMTKDDFIDSTGTETKVKLYFANEEGNGLVEYVTDLTYNGTGSLEEIILQQLIDGPSQVGMSRAIPEGTKLNKVEMKEGICYVDFDEKFLDKIEGISDDVAIYSIVNTMIELPYIDKVQFLIDGKAVKLYGDGTTFDEPFERNLSLLNES